VFIISTLAVSYWGDKMMLIWTKQTTRMKEKLELNIGQKPEGKITVRFRHYWNEVIKIAFNKAAN